MNLLSNFDDFKSYRNALDFEEGVAFRHGAPPERYPCLVLTTYDYDDDPADNYAYHHFIFVEDALKLINALPGISLEEGQTITTMELKDVEKTV